MKSNANMYSNALTYCLEFTVKGLSFLFNDFDIKTRALGKKEQLRLGLPV